MKKIPFLGIALAVAMGSCKSRDFNTEINAAVGINKHQQPWNVGGLTIKYGEAFSLWMHIASLVQEPSNAAGEKFYVCGYVSKIDFTVANRRDTSEIKDTFLSSSPISPTYVAWTAEILEGYERIAAHTYPQILAARKTMSAHLPASVQSLETNEAEVEKFIQTSKINGDTQTVEYELNKLSSLLELFGPTFTTVLKIPFVDARKFADYLASQEQNIASKTPCLPPKVLADDIEFPMLIAKNGASLIQREDGLHFVQR